MSEPMQQAGGGSGPSGPRAGFWRRFGASLIDSVILVVIYYVLVVIAGEGAAAGLYLVLSIAYYTFLEGTSGQTLGKKVLGIRVISLEGGGAIGFGRAFIRYIGRIVSTIPLLLGYFWMLWDKEKQTWHDKFAGSVVVPESAYPVTSS